MKKPRERTNWEKQLPLVNSVRRLAGAGFITQEQAKELHEKIQAKYPIDQIAAVLRTPPSPRCGGCNKEIGKTQTYSNVGGLLYCTSCKPILP